MLHISPRTHFQVNTNQNVYVRPMYATLIRLCGKLFSTHLGTRRKNASPEPGPYETASLYVLPAPRRQACPVPHMSSFVRHSDKHSMFERSLSNQAQKQKESTLTLVIFGSPLFELFRTLPNKTLLTCILGYIDEKLTNALDVSQYPDFLTLCA